MDSLEIGYDGKKPSGRERTAAARNRVAKAPRSRHRKRIPQAGFFFYACCLACLPLSCTLYVHNCQLRIYHIDRITG